MERQDSKIIQAHEQIKYPSLELGFDRLYNFTTENIQGYMDFFDLKNKSLLTVGSSSDQVLNAFYCGCKDITLIDINPYIKEYFYLKKAAILTLDYEEFFKFLSIQGEKVYNWKALNKKIYRKVAKNIEDTDSRKFWDEIFDFHNNQFIKIKLFNMDTERNSMIKSQNNYLRTEKDYKRMKRKIKRLNPEFIVKDIYFYHLDKKYDNIFLSNIADYYEVEETHKLYQRLQKNLNPNGKMLVSYLYGTTRNTKYEERFCRIYNLEKTLPLFENTTLETVKSKDVEEKKDSILTYQKKML